MIRSVPAAAAAAGRRWTWCVGFKVLEQQTGQTLLAKSDHSRIWA